MSGPAAILDACTLVPYRLATTLLWLAEAGLFHPLWSDEILAEVKRNLIAKLDVPSDKAARRIALMRESFGAEALVDGFEDLTESMTCQPKDRHVLAAAVHGGAEVIVTSNLKDFPEESIAPHGIETAHPDVFLTQLLAVQTGVVLSVLEEEIVALRKPPETTIEFLRSLAGAVPTFANLAADASTESSDRYADVPALVSTDENDALAAFGKAGDWTNPRQVGLRWWFALLDGDLDRVRALTYSPRGFGDYRWAVELIGEKSLASHLIPAIDAPDEVAYLRFVPKVARSSRVFAPYVATMTFLTLVRRPDETWRVWGLGPGLVPTHEMVRD